MIFTAYTARHHLTRIAGLRRASVEGATFSMVEGGVVVHLHGQGGIIWVGSFTDSDQARSFMGWACR